MTVPEGIGQRWPPETIVAPTAAGWVVRRSTPISSKRVSASGRRASTDSAPTSTRAPPTCSRRSLPPTRSPAS